MSAAPRAPRPRGLRCRVNVRVAVSDADGRVRAQQDAHNLVVTAGLTLLAAGLNGEAPAGLTHFAVGTSATPAAASQTALVAEVFRDTVTQRTKAIGQLTVTYYLPTDSANGHTLREAGLFTDARAGTLYARVVLASAIPKTNSQAVTFTWTLTWSV